MDAHLFRRLAEIFARMIAGARLEKIQEISPSHLHLTFYASGQKRHFYLRHGRKEPFCFFSASKSDSLPKPSAQVMRLRKYLVGRRIASIVIQPWQRKIWLLAVGSEGGKSVWLCVDLVRGPSLHFLEANALPESDQPHWPTALEEAVENWRDWPVLTPALRRTLAFLPPAEQAALVADLADGNGDIFLYRDGSGAVCKVSAWPLPPVLREGLNEETCEDAAAALERAGHDLVFGTLAEARLKTSLQPGKKRLRQIESALAKLKLDETRLQRMAAQEEMATALSASLWRFAPDTKTQSIVLPENGMTIPLQARYTLVENMERMFHAARRGKRGLGQLRMRRETLEAERLALARGQQAPLQQSDPAQARSLLPCLPRHVQGFTSSDGFQLLRGKDSKGNLAVLRHASGHDIWVHVEQGAGAHIIIRRPHSACEIPERTLVEAGTLAANKSWLAGADSGAVMYAEVRHVKPIRHGAPGKVTIDRVRETRMVPVDHGLEQKLEK